MLKKNKMVCFSIMIALFIGSIGGQMLNYAESNNSVIYINGAYGTDELINENGVTYVPLRVCSELLGANVQWNFESNQIDISKNDKKLQFVVNQKFYVVDGEKKEIQSAPKIIKEMTYIPFRILFESLGANVEYQVYGEHRSYIHAYDQGSTFIKHLENLKSNDLTTKRIAMIEAPRLDYTGGSRESIFIFPLNENTNYFFCAMMLMKVKTQV